MLSFDNAAPILWLHSVRDWKKTLFWLKTPLSVSTSPAGCVPLSHLQILKRSLELWSLAWQHTLCLSLPAGLLPHMNEETMYNIVLMALGGLFNIYDTNVQNI